MLYPIRSTILSITSTIYLVYSTDSTTQGQYQTKVFSYNFANLLSPTKPTVSTITINATPEGRSIPEIQTIMINNIEYLLVFYSKGTSSSTTALVGSVHDKSNGSLYTPNGYDTIFG